ncbi:hypothetical protein ACQ4LE_003390 [Meloidogyne hapla]
MRTTNILQPSLNHSNFCFLFLFLMMLQYTLALYIIQPEELIALKQANDERDELELALRWRSLQRALQGRIDDLMDKERFYSQLPYERGDEIIRSKRQPLIFIEPEFEENGIENENEDDGEDYMRESEDGEQPMMLIIEEKQPELEDDQLYFLPN